MSFITAVVKGHPRDVICLVALWCGHKFLLYFWYAEVVFRILSLSLLIWEQRVSASDDGALSKSSWIVNSYFSWSSLISKRVSSTVSESSPQPTPDVINSMHGSISLSYINFKLVRRFKWGSSVTCSWLSVLSSEYCVCKFEDIIVWLLLPVDFPVIVKTIEFHRSIKDSFFLRSATKLCQQVC